MFRDYFTNGERKKYFKQKIKQDLALPYHPTILARLYENLKSLKNITDEGETLGLEEEIKDYSGGIE